MASASSTLYFQLHQTAETFIRSFDYDECVKEIGTLSRTLTADCEHFINPSSIHESLSIAGLPLSNKEIEERVANILRFLHSYSLEAKDVTVDEIQRKVVVQAIHHVTMKAECGSDDCSLETVFTIWMTEDGAAIRKVHQFVDSLSATKFIEDQQWVSRRAEERDPG